MNLAFYKWAAAFGIAIVGTLAQAQTATPPAAAYRIGAGDEVHIKVYGQPELAAEAQVNSDGMVLVPLLGNIAIAGQTTAMAATLIAQRYQQDNVLKNAQVNVLVSQYRSQSVAILGKVNSPGRLVLEGPTSLTQALAWAGGIAAAGSERILLMRLAQDGSQERIEYDLQQLLSPQNQSLPTIWLKNGDTLYVPNAGRFYLNGEVHSPGMYPLDRPLNVRQALSAGGGPTASASNSGVKLFRQGADGSVQELRAKPDDQVMDGDVLVVKESIF